jgi:hypothetical protein
VKKKPLVVAALGITAATILLTGCSTAADTTSYNISQAAENFEVDRRIVFFNGITDTYLLEIQGRCNIEDDGGQLEVTCKLGEDEYKKHFLGLSDNVSYFVEQTEPSDVDPFHYRVIFRPETIIPDIDISTSGGSPLPDPDAPVEPIEEPDE